MGVPTLDEVFDDIRSYVDFLSQAGCRGVDCSSESLALVKSWGRGRPVPPAPPVPREPVSPPAVPVKPAADKRETVPASAADNVPARGQAEPEVSKKPAAVTVEKAAPEGDVAAAPEEVSQSGMVMLDKEIARCEKCPLRAGSQGAFTGMGSADARVVFVTGVPDPGAEPGGNPFAGESGALLDRMVKAMHLPVESVFYTSIVRCMPGGNSPLLKQAFASCMPYFWKQLGLVKPEVVVTFGTFASCAVTGRKTKISEFRGQIEDVGGVKVMPTHHPSEMLRDESLKRPVWNDLKQVMGILGIRV